MLSDNIRREIENQIERELRDARMAFDHAEKLECYERIAALKAALDPQPTREQILTELAEAISEAQKTMPSSDNPTLAETLVDLVGSFRRRQ